MTALLVDVAPYPVFPATRGGAIVIHHANVAVSASMEVRLISQGLRKSEWRSALRGGFAYQHSGAYREERAFSLPSLVVGYLLGQRAAGSMLSADRTLRLARPGLVREAMGRAAIVQVEHPWQVPAIAQWNAGRRPLVMVAHNAEADLAEQTGRPAKEVEGIRKREAEAVAASDAVITFTDEDRSRLSALAGARSKKFHVIPLGVDTERIRPASADERIRAKAALGLEKKRVVLFVGSLYAPNVEAAREVFRIAKELDQSDVVFVIAGRVGERFRSNERVLVTGEVEDMARYFAAADLAINPMRSGGGMQVKCLEFLASGLPTVTTPLGSRGMTVGSRDAFLATDLQGFPAAIASLLDDEEAAAKLGTAGRKLVEGAYSWSSIGRERLKVYRRLMEPRRSGSLRLR